MLDESIALLFAAWIATSALIWVVWVLGIVAAALTAGRHAFVSLALGTGLAVLLCASLSTNAFSIGVIASSTDVPEWGWNLMTVGLVIGETVGSAIALSAAVAHRRGDPDEDALP